ncbi:MAG: 4-hydroxythreonine-4-phosphate dehydrogenase PdxA [Planctomycetia bacterium]|nr:4-hydroxythreonine-4-phosphate dehydrogenase PdxA [Planctomycetia bacterium]
MDKVESDDVVRENRPVLALTLGDPCGVGPEIVATGITRAQTLSLCRPIAVGSAEILREAVELWRIPAEVVSVDTVEEAVTLARSDDPAKSPSIHRILCVRSGPSFAIGCIRKGELPAGEIDARGGDAAFRAVQTAAQSALDGLTDGIVTAPLHKAAMHLAGHDYPGHTELLAQMCGVTDFAMMLYLGHDAVVRPPHGLAVVHVTLHTAMRNVFREMTGEAIREKTSLVAHFMRRMGCERPRIAVCALNCHNGEGGLFGDEERTTIRPAVERSVREGLEVTGPLSVDTIFVHARDGHYDAVVAMYHDQGHIALKLIGMHRAVNVTLGLPIVRTSVAHGTAFDRAWRGPESGVQIGSIMEAIRCAAKLATTGSTRR